MGRHKLIKNEPQEEVLEVTFDDGEKAKDEPQEEVVKEEEEKQPTSFRGTGRFEYKLSKNGSYFVISPEGQVVTPMDLTEDKAKDFVFRFNK